MHEPGVMSGSLRKPAGAPEPRVVGCVPPGVRTGQRVSQPTLGWGWELKRSGAGVHVPWLAISCWALHGHE